jgi:hypothetical protein
MKKYSPYVLPEPPPPPHASALAHALYNERHGALTIDQQWLLRDWHQDRENRLRRQSWYTRFSDYLVAAFSEEKYDEK